LLLDPQSNEALMAMVNLDVDRATAEA